MREQITARDLRATIRALLDARGLRNVRVPAPERLPPGATDNGANWRLPGAGATGALREVARIVQIHCDLLGVSLLLARLGWLAADEEWLAAALPAFA